MADHYYEIWGLYFEPAFTSSVGYLFFPDAGYCPLASRLIVWVLSRFIHSLDDDVIYAALEDIFYPGRNKDNEERLILDYPKIHNELAKKGVILSLLWTVYLM